MNVYPIPAFNDNYIWALLGNPRSAIIVDPGQADPVIAYLNEHQLPLGAILLTHHHPDHSGGIANLLQHYPGTPIYGVQDSRLDFAIAHLTEFSLWEFNFKTLFTPGHTKSHVCFYEKNYGLLFCGDTLFSAGCGRVFDGTMAQLFSSLQQLKQLPDATKVYCGHEYTRQNLKFAAHVEPANPDILALQQTLNNINGCSLPSSIELEKRINPFFRTDHSDIQLFTKNLGCSNVNEQEIFSVLRQEKDKF